MADGIPNGRSATDGASLFLRDVWALVAKDIILLWRDRSLLFIVLLWLTPLAGFLKTPVPPSVADLQPKQHATNVQPSQKRPPGAPETVGAFGPAAKAPVDLPEVKVGVIGGTPIEIPDKRFGFITIPESSGYTKLLNGSVDVLAKFPTATGQFAPFSRITIIHNEKRRSSEVASHMLYSQLHDLQFKGIASHIGSASGSSDRWIVYSTTFNQLEDPPADERVESNRIWGIGGALVLAAALMASLIMLTTVEENSEHTLPLVLVSARNRQVIFASKFALCALPCIGALFAATARTYKALPRVPPNMVQHIEVLAATLGSGALFIAIAAAVLIICGGRARNNIEALPKLGGPLILLGFLITLASSPMASFTPGLILVPITNLIFCIRELLHEQLQWQALLISWITSGAMALVFLRLGVRGFRCEHGLPGEVAGRDPKLDGFLLFALGSTIAILLYNFAGLPARIVYPSLGDLIVATIYLSICVGIIRTGEISPKSLLGNQASKRKLVLWCVAGLLLAPFTAWLFYTAGASAAFALDPETARLQSLARSDSQLVFIVLLVLVRICSEELLLRGTFVALLQGKFPTLGIVASIACISAALHPLAGTWILMALFGGILTAMRLASKSIAPTLIWHVTHQLISLFVFRVLGQTF